MVSTLLETGGCIKSILPSSVALNPHLNREIIKSFGLLATTRSAERILNYTIQPRPFKQSFVVFKRCESESTVHFFSNSGVVALDNRSVMLESLPHFLSLLSEDMQLFRSSMQSLKMIKQIIWLRGTYLAAALINLVESAFPGNSSAVDSYRGIILS